MSRPPVYARHARNGLGSAALTILLSMGFSRDGTIGSR